MPNPPVPPPQPHRKPTQRPKIVIRKPASPTPASDPAPASAAKAPVPAASQVGPQATFKGFKVLYWTFSFQGMIFMAAGLAILAVAVVIFYLSLVDYGLKSNYNSGLHLHDTNQAPAAVRQFEDALWWKSDHHWAREGLAKIYAESNELDRAEQQYRQLLARGHRAAYVHVGLGVVALRRADQEKEPAVALKHADAALASFQAAGSVPEAAAGRGLTLLLIATRSNNPAKLFEARSAFDEALKAAEAGQKMTRSGLLDLYAGYGASLAMIGQNLEFSYSLSKRAAVLAPNWETPEANASLAVARWCWESPPGPSEITTVRAKLDRWLALSQQKASQNRAFPGLQSSWSRMAGAIARVYLYQGDVENFRRIMDQIVYAKGDERFGKMLKAAVVAEAFDPSNMAQDIRFVEQQVLASLSAIASDEGLVSPVEIRMRAFAHNGIGVVREWLIARYGMQGDMAKNLDVRRALEQAVALDPECFPAWLNLALMHKRIAGIHPPGTPRQESMAAAKAALEKAESALQARPADPGARERLARARALVGGN